MKAIVLKLMLVILLFASSVSAQSEINTFIMDYPHGEYRMHVKRTGEAYLYYGAGATAQVIKKGTFSVEGLDLIFKKHLHPNLPREQWPNPKSQAGMVTIKYTNGSEESYLIFDLNELTDKIFKKAKENIKE